VILKIEDHQKEAHDQIEIASSRVGAHQHRETHHESSSWSRQATIISKMHQEKEVSARKKKQKQRSLTYGNNYYFIRE